MKWWIVLTLMLTGCSPAWACESYEECMNYNDGWMHTMGSPEHAQQNQAKLITTLKAIDYKFEELIQYMKPKEVLRQEYEEKILQRECEAARECSFWDTNKVEAIRVHCHDTLNNQQGGK